MESLLGGESGLQATWRLMQERWLGIHQGVPNLLCTVSRGEADPYLGISSAEWKMSRTTSGKVRKVVGIYVKSSWRSEVQAMNSIAFAAASTQQVLAEC